MKNNENWKIRLTWLAIGALIAFLLSLFSSLVVIPYFIDRPKIELLVVEPKLCYQGKMVNLSAILENTGKKTASDLFVYAIEQNETPHQYGVVKNSPQTLQTGKEFNATISLQVPDGTEQYWIISLYVTTPTEYKWQFNIVYEYLNNSGQYHLISWA